MGTKPSQLAKQSDIIRYNQVRRDGGQVHTCLAIFWGPLVILLFFYSFIYFLRSFNRQLEVEFKFLQKSTKHNGHAKLFRQLI